MARTEDKELQEYRRLMEPPEDFEDGFNWRTVIGAIFLGFVMMPGSMYLRLVIGSSGSIDIAARWVTIILFAEVARRSFKDLKMQEVYILYYMAGLALASPFEGLLWNQYLVRSDYAQAMGISQEIPSWIAPSADQIRQAGHTFFTRAWVVPVLFVSFALVVSKIDYYGLGYVLYRLTSDVEELPFPMAPVAASGITALVQTREDKQAWRWRYFSIGGMLGLMFGIIYIGVPAATGAILAKPVQLIPIPWVDFTPTLGKYVPAAPLNITLDLGSFILGMVIPFWAVVGGFLGSLLTIIANPILYHRGILTNWQPQMGVVDTLFSNEVDFYLPFGVGLTVAIALVSTGKIFDPLVRYVILRRRPKPANSGELGFKEKIRASWQKLVTNNVKRGDFSIFIALAIYAASSTLWIGLSTWLIPGFPWWFFVGYAVLYIPLISYATAKLEGLCGQALSMPMIKEVTYILSGYRGVKIWFAPAPIPNYGIATVEFRILELTGTKIISQIKTQIITIPIIIIASLIFSQLLWHMADVPSDAYPFAQKMWDLQAKKLCLTYSSTMEGGSLFMEAWKWKYFGSGVAVGTISFAVLSLLGLPTLLVFGLVRGLGMVPGMIYFQMLGALVGKFYFRRRIGDIWMKYTPVLLAGFSCGMGLVAMVAVAFTVLTKMMAPLLY